MDYCVKWTALDTLKSGLKVKVLTDAVKGVNTKAGDYQRAIEEMARSSAGTITIDKLKL